VRRISPESTIYLKIAYLLGGYLIRNQITKYPGEEEDRDLPWMRSALLVIHILVVIATATLFLFQMTTLVASINAYFGETVITIKNRRRTCGAQVRKRRRRGRCRKGPIGIKERDKSGLLRVCRDTNQLEKEGELRVVASQSAGFRRQTRAMSRT
jgi:hypothetical protein